MDLKFFAGLTNLDDISDDELLPQPSDHELLPLPRDLRKYNIIAATTIHFLFEAKQRIKMLNSLSGVIFKKVSYHHSMSPFDCYMLGYIVSLTTCSWKIDIICHSDNAVAMLAKGTLASKHKNIHPAEALPVSLSIDGGLMSHGRVELSDFFKAYPSFLKRIIYLKLEGVGLDGHSCEFFSESNCMSLIPHIEVLSLARNSVGSTQKYRFSENSSSQPLSSRSDSPTLAVKLIDALKTKNTAKLLNFMGTTIGEPECEALAQWLSSPRIECWVQ